MFATLVAVSAFAGLSSPNKNLMETQDAPALGQTAAPTATAPAKGEEVAVLTTDSGTIILKFFPDRAPKHVESFKKLVKDGFYTGTRFHRCIAGFMIQGGDPNSKDMSKASMWGTGGPGFHLDAEFNDQTHARGVLSMARSSDPNSAGSQFFICVKDSKFLDHQYTAFGIVVQGMDTADKIVVTGDAQDNGKVEPEKAVAITKAEIKTWPISD